MIAIGLDIGGTKCAVSVGECGQTVSIKERIVFPTAGKSWRDVLALFAEQIERFQRTYAVERIGISCGGPLDSQAGVIQSPPNLPGWDDVPIVAYFSERFHLPVFLQNDANAGALAEWKFGAGKRCRNMVFMTFGTGLGAGLVLNGKLYAGTNDNAGEIGHIRLAPDGPIGYNKAGSAEGFCSGAGIGRLAQIRARERGLELPESFSAKEIFAKMREGDVFCTEIVQESAQHLGEILSFVMDVLNPELIVLGGVFMRNADVLLPLVEPVLVRESLPGARAVCRIVPAEIGESIGDVAALAVASGDFL